MIDRATVEAVERVVNRIEDDRKFWERHRGLSSCYYQLTSSPEDAMIIQGVLKEWLYGTKNSSNDEQKGDKWTITSVDENGYSIFMKG